MDPDSTSIVLSYLNLKYCKTHQLLFPDDMIDCMLCRVETDKNWNYYSSTCYTCKDLLVKTTQVEFKFGENDFDFQDHLIQVFGIPKFRCRIQYPFTKMLIVKLYPRKNGKLIYVVFTTKNNNFCFLLFVCKFDFNKIKKNFAKSKKNVN